MVGMTSTTDTAHPDAAEYIAEQALDIDCADLAEFRVATLTPGRFDAIVTDALARHGLGIDSETVATVLALANRTITEMWAMVSDARSALPTECLVCRDDTGAIVIADCPNGCVDGLIPRR